MKRTVCFLCFVISFFAAVYAEKPLSFEGTWTYTFYHDDTCVVYGGKIINHSKDYHSFRIALLLLEKKCTGFSDYAYTAGKSSFLSVSPNAEYSVSSFSISDFIKSKPKTGTYYPVVVLLCRKSDSYGVVDYLTFDDPIKFVNPTDEEVDRLLKEYESAEEQEREWTMLGFGVPHEAALAAMERQQYFASQKNSVIMKLNALNYDYRTGRRNYYAKTEYYKNYSSLPDEPATSTYASTYDSGYYPDYSDYSDESSSSSRTGMHQQWDTCPSCHGTGKSSKIIESSGYIGSNRVEWCEYCKDFVHPHTHDVCRQCNGRGMWQHWVKD